MPKAQLVSRIILRTQIKNNKRLRGLHCYCYKCLQVDCLKLKHPNSLFKRAQFNFLPYAVGTGAPWGITGTSGLAPFCSEMGVVGWGSSLGSTMLTWSGRGFLGPILPLGSQGSMILTLIPSTPENNDQGQQQQISS